MILSKNKNLQYYGLLVSGFSNGCYILLNSLQLVENNSESTIYFVTVLIVEEIFIIVLLMLIKKNSKKLFFSSCLCFLYTIEFFTSFFINFFYKDQVVYVLAVFFYRFALLNFCTALLNSKRIYFNLVSSIF